MTGIDPITGKKNIRFYMILSDIITEHRGTVHGSQSHIVGTNNNLQLIVSINRLLWSSFVTEEWY